MTTAIGAKLMKRRVPMIHDGCGTLMFYAERIHPRGSILSPHEVTYPNGTKPNWSDVVTCPKCGVVNSWLDVIVDPVYNVP